MSVFMDAASIFIKSLTSGFLQPTPYVYKVSQEQSVLSICSTVSVLKAQQNIFQIKPSSITFKFYEIYKAYLKGNSCSKLGYYKLALKVPIGCVNPLTHLIFTLKPTGEESSLFKVDKVLADVESRAALKEKASAKYQLSSKERTIKSLPNANLLPSLLMNQDVLDVKKERTLYFKSYKKIADTKRALSQRLVIANLIQLYLEKINLLRRNSGENLSDHDLSEDDPFRPISWFRRRLLED